MGSIPTARLEVACGKTSSSNHAYTNAQRLAADMEPIAAARASQGLPVWTSEVSSSDSLRRSWSTVREPEPIVGKFMEISSRIRPHELVDGSVRLLDGMDAVTRASLHLRFAECLLVVECGVAQRPETRNKFTPKGALVPHALVLAVQS